MWNDSRRQLAGALGLFAVNAWFCRELFTTVYTIHMGSIEAAYISLARYISEHPLAVDWFPLWYVGIPFQNAYPPLLHLTTGGLAGLTGISPAVAYHAVAALTYCLVPVTLYWLAATLSQKTGPALVAAAFYSVLSPSALLFPKIAGDMGDLLASRRFQALTQYGEGPHSLSMALLPVVIVLLYRALERFTPLHVFLAAAGAAGVVLSNWLGAFSLAVAALCCLLCRADRREPRTWLRAATIGAIAYLLAAPWVPPSTIADVQRNAQHVVGSYPVEAANLIYVAIAAALVALADWLLRRASADLLLRFAVLFSIVIGSLPAADALLGVSILPQPERYHLELSMGLWLALGSLTATLLAKLPGRARVILSAALAGLFFVQAKTTRDYASRMSQSIEIESTPEYRLAQAARSQVPNARVWAEGSVGFWLNAWSDHAQLGGGFDQGISNPFLPVVTFAMMAEEAPGETCAQWLRAYGFDAVLVGGFRSGIALPSVPNPEKFEQGFETAWAEGPLAIQVVDRRSRSLAHAIHEQDRVRREPVNGLDIEPVLPLLQALEDPLAPAIEWQWTAPDHARISASLSPGQLVYVQVTADPGWTASVRGEKRGIERDPLGLMVISPRCDGPCEVELIYDGGTETLLARTGQLLGVVGLALWGLRQRMRPC